jgi:CheY-like chemotaxis protein
MAFKKIALVEDDPAIMDVLSLLFKTQQMEVTCYINGSALLEKRFEIPDIFLIDKQLSGVDGLEICRHLKSGATTKHIPVIVISASPHVRQQAMIAGANEFIEKPFSNKLLLGIVFRHLGMDG